MDIYLKEVLSQPAAIANAIDIYFSKEYLGKAANYIESFNLNKGSNIYFTGMGSSYCSAYGSVMYLNSKGINAFLKRTGEFVYYGIHMLKNDDAVIIISQSGGSAEVVRLVEELKQRGFTNYILIANEEACVLRDKVEKILFMKLESEKSVSTRTHMASIMINMIISHIVTGDSLDHLKGELELSSRAISKYLGDYKANTDRIIDFLGGPGHLEFLGRGAAYGCAQASALCTKEYVKQYNEALELDEFKHGPLEIVKEGFRAFVFAPNGKTYGLSLKMAVTIVENGGKVVFVTDKDPEINNKQMLTIVLQGGNEYLSQMVQFLPHQLLNQAWAEMLGVKKDGLLYGGKVTEVE
jgi:glutamine---fructose-6-phosphate transaminase (isomerizing)